jgi:hypothetical protein
MTWSPSTAVAVVEVVVVVEVAVVVEAAGALVAVRVEALVAEIASLVAVEDEEAGAVVEAGKMVEVVFSVVVGLPLALARLHMRNARARSPKGGGVMISLKAIRKVSGPTTSSMPRRETMAGEARLLALPILISKLQTMS